jgi:glyoxylase-like metal-dependent hydrolase (beta-lactamase superfamily II)
MTDQRWTAGDIELVRVVEFEVGAPTEDSVPAWVVERGFGDESGLPLIASTATVVAAGSSTIVVDPWLVFDGDRTDIAAQTARTTSLLDGLAAAGFSAEDVDLVVNSHVDGVGGNVRPDRSGRWAPTFPNARYLFSSTELELSADDERLDPLRDADVIDPVDPPREIAPGVTLVEEAGHRPGHLVVRLRRGRHEALLPGHLFISPLQVSDPAIALDEDAATATAIRRRLLTDLAQSGGLLIAPLLGGPGGGVVEPDGNTWRLTPV